MANNLLVFQVHAVVAAAPIPAVVIPENIPAVVLALTPGLLHAIFCTYTLTFLFFLVLKLNLNFSVLFEIFFQGSLYIPNIQQIVKATDIMKFIMKSRICNGKNSFISLQTQGTANVKLYLLECGSDTRE